MIKLYVNYTELEIGQDTQNILATFSINDVAGVAERRGSITQEMFLPATPVNSQTLASCPASGYVASIESNGIVCFTGKLRVSKTEYLRGEVVGYSCTMYGDNLDFAYLLSQKQMRELSRVAATQFKITDTNILSGIAGKVAFPLVNYGKLETVNQIAINEIRPAISVEWLLNRFFEEIGYTVESTFSSGDLADCYLLFTCGEYLCAAASKLDYEFRASLTADQNGTYTGGGLIPFFWDSLRCDDDTTAPNYDPNGIYDTTTYRFKTNTYPYGDRKYRITFNLRCTDVGRPIPFAAEYSGGGISNFIFPNLISDDGSLIVYQSDWVTLLPAQEYYLGIIGANGAAYSIEQDSWVSLERMPEATEGDTVDIADCLPKETTQLAFLKGLVHCFNLYIYADVALRKVYIEPRNRYYSEYGGALVDGFYPNESIFSINDIIDIGENYSISIYDNLGESLIIGYGDGDNYVAQIESGTNKQLYSAGWNMQTQTTVKPKNYDNPVFGRFSLIADTQTAVEQLGPNSDPYTPAIIMPRLWSADWVEGEDYPAKSYDFPPMLAIIRSGVACPDWTLVYSGTATPNDYFYAYMFDYPALSGSDFSLSYGNEIDFNGNTVAGLFQRFYLREQVSKRGGEVLKLRAVVSAWLINYLNNIKYMTFIEYSGNIYSIQEIRNFVIGEDSICEITLLLERFASESDVNNIENNTLNCLNNVS